VTLAEFLAKVSWLSSEEGGRTHPVATGYRAGMFFDPESSEGNDGLLTLVDKRGVTQAGNASRASGHWFQSWLSRMCAQARHSSFGKAGEQLVGGLCSS